MRSKEGILVVLSAPSGGGKTTVCNRLMAADSNVVRSVSCATRPPRVGEVEGKDYYFISLEDFEKRIAREEFLEYAQVHGNYYGTLRKTVEDLLVAGRDVILTIDVQGAESIRKLAEKDAKLARSLVTVFLMPPSMSVLEKRLRSRQTDTEEVIRRRLDQASQEIACWPTYNYVIVSGTVDEDYRQLQDVLDAERCRASRVLLPEEFR